MRNQNITNAVVNVVEREDRVTVIGCLVAPSLHLRQQLLSFATAFAKPGTPTGVPHSIAKYWLECSGRISAMLMSCGGKAMSLRGLALPPVAAGLRNA